MSDATPREPDPDRTEQQTQPNTEPVNMAGWLIPRTAHKLRNRIPPTRYRLSNGGRS